MLFKEALSRAGLTTTQGEILGYLYQNKEAKASEVAQKIKRSRTIVYQEMEKMEEMGIVLKEEKPNQVAIFAAAHPSVLKKLLESKEAQLRKDRQLLESYLPEVISSYNLNHNRPGIKFYEGAKGLEKIYEEILKEGKDFHLFRTAYESVYNDKIAPIVENFIKRRVKKGIKVTAIVPSDVKDPGKDAGWLMKRFNVDQRMYTAPVEIDIFGSKVAVLSFGEELIGMIFDSKQIAESLRQIFILATFASKKAK